MIKNWWDSKTLPTLQLARDDAYFLCRVGRVFESSPVKVFAIVKKLCGVFEESGGGDVRL